MGRSKKEETSNENETKKTTTKKITKTPKKETKTSSKKESKKKIEKTSIEKNIIQNVEEPKEPVIKNPKVSEIKNLEQISPQLKPQIQDKPKSKKGLIALIILFIIGILIVVGIIIVPKVLEMIEDNDNEKSNTVTETIEVKVIPSYNESAYVIEGIPDTVKVEITGKKKAVKQAKENSDNEIRLDLSDYQPSKEKTKVKIKYNCPEKVECTVKPSSIKVSIQDKVSIVKQVKYKILENTLLEHINIKSVDLSRNEVVIKGSQDTLDLISEVTALIDINDLIDTNAGNFLQLGTRYVNNLKIVAYDKKGKEITNVDIVPSTISAEIELESNSKEVPLELNFVGELAPGRAISSITINGMDINSYKTEVSGNEKAIAEIKYLSLSLDLDGLSQNESKTFKVTLLKPPGITYIKDEEVTIEIKFAEAKQKTIELKGIQARNVPDGFIATINNPEDNTVTVELIGSSDILDNFEINDSNIIAYVDLKDLKEGPNSVQVNVDIKDPRLKCIVTKKININLNKQ